MGRYSGKTCRLLCMLCLTGSFFLVEIIVGYVTNSLALMGDSYHMLSDVLALLIGFASVRISKWDSHKNTYGWARAEVLGALINAVFLIALCFTIFVEALERLTHNEVIHDPILLMVVGGLGLLVNGLGLILFAGHAHSHGGHGHSHGGHGHSHASPAHTPQDKVKASANKEEIVRLQDGANAENSDVISSREETDSIDIEEHVTKSSAQLNMKGVFLHVLGDALGSVIVIISAVVINFVESDWKYKVDPILSMILVLIILSTAFPLFKESALILLQTVPTHIQVADLKEKLLSKVEGIIAVHEFHVWQLAGNRIIASAHITCQNLRDYMRVAEDVKEFFHNEGIHSTTIQPEFIELCALTGQHPLSCQIPCPDDNCMKSRCCKKDHCHTHRSVPKSGQKFETKEHTEKRSLNSDLKPYVSSFAIPLDCQCTNKDSETAFGFAKTEYVGNAGGKQHESAVYGVPVEYRKPVFIAQDLPLPKYEHTTNKFLLETLDKETVV